MKGANQKTIIVTVKQDAGTANFLQQLRKQHIAIRKLVYHKNQLLFEMNVQHLQSLRKIRKQCGVSISIHYKSPQKILQRDAKTFIGILLLFIIPFVLAQFIWQVEIKANTVELSDEVNRYMVNEVGLQLPISKKRFFSDNEMRQKLMEQFRQFSWVHIMKLGSKVTIAPQLAPEVKRTVEKNNNQHLIANNSGVITHFQIERGIRKVVPNMTVYKGDTLVSGVLMRNEEVFVIGAEGEVFADYWLETTFSIPKKIQLEVLTDFGWKYEVQWHQIARSWQEKSVQPLKAFITHRSYRVFQKKTEKISEQDIEKIILPLLHEKMIRSLPVQSTIKSEKLLHVYADDDTVKGKVLYLVNENIATPSPIHQGE